MEMRSTRPEDLREIGDVVRRAMLWSLITDERLAELVENHSDGDWLAMYEAGACIGHVGGFRLDTTVPGGARLPTSGVTGIGVLATHTRRGVLTQLLSQLLADARARGQVLASLRASDALIYARFGFGLAGDRVAGVVECGRALPLRRPRTDGSMRLLLGSEAREILPDVYERVARRRVGTVNRYGWHWERLLAEVNKPTNAEGASATWIAVHRGADGMDDGYIQYSTKWVDGFGENYRAEGTIVDLWGADRDVELALWQYLLDLDLVGLWRASGRPVDDPIRRALHDVRAYTSVHRVDEQWVRILDVDAALAARTYGRCDASVAIEVHDPLFDGNCGRWKIDQDGASRTDADPDATITVDIAALSAAYLGGVSWFDLSASGEIESTDETALTRLDALFAVRPIPFCGTDF